MQYRRRQAGATIVKISRTFRSLLIWKPSKFEREQDLVDLQDLSSDLEVFDDPVDFPDLEDLENCQDAEDLEGTTNVEHIPNAYLK